MHISLEEKQSEPFEFENPSYVMRVCNDDGTPTLGTKTFIWPTSGPVEDSNYVLDKQCGSGLHGCRPNQILDGWRHLTRAKYPIYLICEVEESQITDFSDKCKFPRCNVVYSGTWQGALLFLSNLGLENVPSRAEFFKRVGWRYVSTDAIKSKLPKFKALELSAIENMTAEMLKTQFGNLLDPVMPKDIKRAKAYVARARKTKMTSEEAKDFADIMDRTNIDMRMYLWSMLKRNVDQLFAVHPYIEKLMMATAVEHGYVNWDEKTTFETPVGFSEWSPSNRFRYRDMANAVIDSTKLKTKNILRQWVEKARAAVPLEHDYDYRE